ncbi:hypothetical protein CH35J_004885 [Colletotrichum higginsianum]|uniref:Uncharacterized protein n=1 Tax=Colletotrichum higginsianum TaxID=80884 RepID=A0A4T0WA84_9PEZI|nr:hypothetical protein CH35J_004885 [Colletotrichum higginsianum]
MLTRAGCAGFVHLAVDNGFSPDPTVVVDGFVVLTLRALEAAASEPGLRRFVLTSSYITVCHYHMNGAYDVTQASWNDEYVVVYPDGADGRREETQDGQRGAEEGRAVSPGTYALTAATFTPGHVSLLYASTVSRESFLEEWPSETFIVDAGEQRPAWAVFAELRPPRLMEMRFLLNTGELLLRPSHWRIDRARCLLLMDRFFDIMASEQTASPAWGEEMFRLPPALEDALQLPRRPRSIRNGARSGFLTLGRRRRPSVFLVV